MSPRLARVLGLVFALATAGSLAALEGCGSDATPGGITDDASTSPDSPGSKPDGALDDGALDDGAASDGGADATVDSASDGGTTGKGETCIGFAKGSPCGAVGLPDYGYVCVNGSPPGIGGCKLASSSSFGDTYCCPDDRCVAQPDQDGMCKTAAKSHRFQCPPDGAGGNVAPASGCVDGGFGGSALEHFFCCP